MARCTFPERFVKLVVMTSWAIFDGRFEPDDARRIPVRRALTFAWESVNLLGSLGVRKSPCGCERRFGRPLLFCGTHAGWGD